MRATRRRNHDGLAAFDSGTAAFGYTASATTTFILITTNTAYNTTATSVNFTTVPEPGGLPHPASGLNIVYSTFFTNLVLKIFVAYY